VVYGAKILKLAVCLNLEILNYIISIKFVSSFVIIACVLKLLDVQSHMDRNLHLEESSL
jgi:hypothetical protein